MQTTDSSSLIDILRTTVFGLIEFMKNPLQQISRLPAWHWPQLLFILVLTSITSGALAGIVSLNIYHFLFGIFVLPIISMMTEFVLTAFFYYYFQVFEKRLISFEKLWATVIFANIPFFLFQVVSGLIPPMTLIGLAFTGFLLVIGLTDNFQMDKKRAIRLICIIYLVVFLVWIWNKREIYFLDRQFNS